MGNVALQCLLIVAPFTGAWIEILLAYLGVEEVDVAPFTGAWIEMYQFIDRRVFNSVAPFTGAWIEI